MGKKSRARHSAKTSRKGDRGPHSSGAPRDRGEEGGKTALHMAAQNNQVELVKLLITSGANVDVQSNGGNSPLHLTCERGHFRASRTLLLGGANPVLKNNAGKTPLHVLKSDCDRGEWEAMFSPFMNVSEDEESASVLTPAQELDRVFDGRVDPTDSFAQLWLDEIGVPEYAPLLRAGGVETVQDVVERVSAAFLTEMSITAEHDTTRIVRAAEELRACFAQQTTLHVIVQRLCYAVRERGRTWACKVRRGYSRIRDTPITLLEYTEAGSAGLGAEAVLAGLQDAPNVERILKEECTDRGATLYLVESWRHRLADVAGEEATWDVPESVAHWPRDTFWVRRMARHPEEYRIDAIALGVLRALRAVHLQPGDGHVHGRVSPLTIALSRTRKGVWMLTEWDAMNEIGTPLSGSPERYAQAFCAPEARAAFAKGETPISSPALDIYGLGASLAWWRRWGGVVGTEMDHAGAEDFIAACLVDEAAKRTSVDKMLAHPFLDDAKVAEAALHATQKQSEQKAPLPLPPTS